MTAQALHDSGIVLTILSANDGSRRAPTANELAPDNALPTFDLNAFGPIPDFPDSFAENRLPMDAPVQPVAGLGTGDKGAVWMEGDVLMCPCPDCAAPMSVRIWLMIADCWRCAASIELSEEQEREARRLVDERERAKRAPAGKAAAALTRPIESPRREPAARPPQPRDDQPARRPAAVAVAAAAPPRLEPSLSSPPTPPRTAAIPPSPARARGGPPAPPPRAVDGRPAPRARVPAAQRANPTFNRARQMARAGAAYVWLRHFLSEMPAWLVSLVFHLVLLTLLALLTMPRKEKEEPFIVLSTSVSKDVRVEGGAIKDDAKEVHFDLPLPKDVDLNDEQQKRAVVLADQDARELRLDPETPDLQLADLSRVKRQIGSSTDTRASLAARDPRLRVDLVKQEGGTTLTEAAVARGLRWIAQQQRPDGRWTLDGGVQSDSAATSLALLPYLGAGQTHLTGRYKDQVAKGLRWLRDQQQPNGDLRANSTANSGMYAQGLATIVLCEAYLMTGDESLRVPAQRAVDFIVKAQHPGGGWRYQPGEAGDTSVVGWQLMALQSARMANLKVPEPTFELASHYLDTVQQQSGALYAYQRGARATHVMTAEGLLCRIYLGWDKDTPGLTRGVDFLLQNFAPNQAPPDIYYWYYGTQTMHHMGGAAWDKWNFQMRDILVNSQDKSGPQAGSWTPQGPHGGGRLYMTSLSTSTLEVYYRHLPIFRQIKLE